MHRNSPSSNDPERATDRAALEEPGQATASAPGSHYLNSIVAAAQYILLPAADKQDMSFDAYLTSKNGSSLGIGNAIQVFGANALGIWRDHDIPMSSTRQAALEYHDLSDEQRKSVTRKDVADKWRVSDLTLATYIKCSGELVSKRWPDSVLGAFRALTAAHHAQVHPRTTTDLPASSMTSCAPRHAGTAPDMREVPSSLLNHPLHPDHRFFAVTKGRLDLLFKGRLGVTRDQSDRIASAMTVEARSQGMKRIDEVHFSNDGAAVWGVQWGSGALGRLREAECGVRLDKAVAESMKNSAERWPGAMRQFESLEQRRSQRQDPLAQQLSVPSMRR